MNQYIRPAFLKKGDTVAVVSMASNPPESAREESWLRDIEAWGVKVRKGKHIYDSIPGDFAGTDEDRASDIEAALLDPEVKAIISWRGGYGSMRTVTHLDTSLFVKHPKWIVGFSDITVFHTLFGKLGLESILGDMPCSFYEGPDSPASIEYLRAALFGELKSYSIAPHPYNRFGKARGRVVGGNLSLWNSTIGTPWENRLEEDCILFLEDVEERMLSVDRMLLTLKCGGWLDRARAVIIGQFTDTAGEDKWNRDVYSLVREYTDTLDVPVLFGFPCGHEHPNMSLYLGREAEIEVSAEGGILNYDI
ncbi:MAG: LD-carboxypeptidase [Bacteroidales bacterium]|nr:LD-carboxypeptidase [Candidatus Cacconaster merdequi]